MADDFDKDKVLSRIRKMLALAGNEAASEGERDNALRMAHATLAKYNLSLGDAEIEQQEPRIEGRAQISPHPWARQLIESIAQLYFCKTIFFLYRDKRQVHHFIGRQSNVVTAIEMAKYVVGSINKEARRKARENAGGGGYERSFCKGAAAAVTQRCLEIRRTAEQQQQQQPAGTGTSLVLASLYKTELDLNMEAVQKTYGKLRVISSEQHSTQSDAFYSGKKYGSSISLNKQVGTEDKAPRLK